MPVSAMVTVTPLASGRSSRKVDTVKDLRDMTIREIEAAYMDSVRGIAEEAIELDAHDGSRDDYIHESVDSSEWVIYTYRAMLVPVVSENGDAYDRDFGGVPDGPMKESQIAHAAMLADVWEHVDLLERRRGSESQD